MRVFSYLCNWWRFYVMTRFIQRIRWPWSTWSHPLPASKPHPLPWFLLRQPSELRLCSLTRPHESIGCNRTGVYGIYHEGRPRPGLPVKALEVRWSDSVSSIVSHCCTHGLLDAPIYSLRVGQRPEEPKSEALFIANRRNPSLGSKILPGHTQRLYSEQSAGFRGFHFSRRN